VARIAHPSGQCQRPRIIRVYAFIDSVEIFLSRLPVTAPWRQLRALGQLKPCGKGHDQWGSRLIVQRPQPDQLARLERLCRPLQGVITRLDIALDWHGGNGDLAERLRRQLILRWRRNGQGIVDVSATSYWCWRFSRTNLVLYDDLPSELTGQPCVHLELRFRRAETIRRQGIKSIADLRRLDPRALFSKYLKWSTAGEDYVEMIVRRECKKARAELITHRPDPFYDRWTAHIPQRVRKLLHNLGYDRAQTIHDRLPHLMSKGSIPGLSHHIPTGVAWKPSLR
jgi:hypothetical protein